MSADSAQAMQIDAGAGSESAAQQQQQVKLENDSSSSPKKRKRESTGAEAVSAAAGNPPPILLGKAGADAIRHGLSHAAPADFIPAFQKEHAIRGEESTFEQTSSAERAAQGQLLSVRPLLPVSVSQFPAPSRRSPSLICSLRRAIRSTPASCRSLPSRFDRAWLAAN